MPITPEVIVAPARRRSNRANPSACIGIPSPRHQVLLLTIERYDGRAWEGLA